MATSKLSPSAATMWYSPTIMPLGVASGQPDAYRKASPGRMVGCSPTTPGPRTSCWRPSASVMRQWRSMQRHRLVAEIGDFDVVTPEITAFARIGMVRLEARLDGDFDLMRDRHVHEFGIVAAGGGASTGFVDLLGRAPPET